MQAVVYVGKNLKELRTRAALTQAELAEDRTKMLRWLYGLIWHGMVKHDK